MDEDSIARTPPGIPFPDNLLIPEALIAGPAPRTRILEA
jgi:hypothetical protein